MKKRIVCFVLIAVLAIGFMPTLSFAASSGEFAGGSGTRINPYLISNTVQLDNVRKYPSSFFRLVCDIEFADSDFENGFNPISEFSGTFDGNGFAVKNLQIRVSADGLVRTGLFAQNRGTINNLVLQDADLFAATASTAYPAIVGGIASENSGVITDCFVSGKVVASSYNYVDAIAGGVVGQNSGEVTGCESMAETVADSASYYAIAGGIVGKNLENGNVTECRNSGNVTSDFSSSYYAYAGGTVGLNNGNVSVCCNTGNIVANSANAHSGGIAGGNTGSITECYNIGAVSAETYISCIGGIVGWNTGVVKDSYNTGNVTGVEFGWAGGIAGYTIGDVTFCYNMSTVSDDEAGGIVGCAVSAEVVNCYYLDTAKQGIVQLNDCDDTTVKCNEAQLKEKETFDGFDFEKVWIMELAHSYLAPQLFKNPQEKIESVEVVTQPTNNVFLKDTIPDLSGATAKIIYDDKTEKIIDVQLRMLKYFDSSFAEKQYQCVIIGKAVSENRIILDCVVELPTPAPEQKPAVEIKDTTTVFTDIKAGKWYTNAVNYAYSYGFIAGVSDNEFGRDVPVTRGMFITILARIAGVNTNANKVDTKFADVKSGKYYTAAIKWASENGVVNGLTETEFGPNAAIERQQLCTMIVNFAKYMNINLTASQAEITFADTTSIRKYAKTSVATCQKAGIVSGYAVNGGMEFKPGNTATRAEAAQILYKFHKDFVA